MDWKATRQISVKEARRWKIVIPELLPLLDLKSIRPKNEIVDRVLVLNAVVATSYGFPHSLAKEWLMNNNRLPALSTVEAQGFEKLSTDSHRQEVECLWCLSWVLSIVPKMPFDNLCGNELVRLLPDLKSSASPEHFISNTQTRKNDEIFQMADLGYCLHWYLKDSGRVPPPLKEHVIYQRRRALEWICSDCDWDDVDLST